jgi:hypothetical protein
MRVRALGTIIEWSGAGLTPSDFYSGMLDYFDHWQSIDPRLMDHHATLSAAADAFGHEIVNLATYSNEILAWLPPSRIQQPPWVVIVGGMTEAFIYTVRSACDVIAAALGQYVSEKPGQVPRDSLRALIAWSAQNPSRIRPSVGAVLSSDFRWFWNLRKLRDALSHRGANANIACNGRQFYLWFHGPQGWIAREPLLPLLADQLRHLTALADQSAQAINGIIGLPVDRLKSRVVNGVLIPALHQLLEIAGEYSEPSP